MFFGRDELLRRIFNALHQNSIMIHGQRRMGKTTLLYQFAEQLRHADDPEWAFIPVYMDLEGTPQPRFFYVLMDALWGVLQAYAWTTPAAGSPLNRRRRIILTASSPRICGWSWKRHRSGRAAQGAGDPVAGRDGRGERLRYRGAAAAPPDLHEPAGSQPGRGRGRHPDQQDVGPVGKPLVQHVQRDPARTIHRRAGAGTAGGAGARRLRVGAGGHRVCGAAVRGLSAPAAAVRAGSGQPDVGGQSTADHARRRAGRARDIERAKTM